MVFSLLALSSSLEQGQSLENHTLDWFYRIRPTVPQSQKLLIVGIDEASFQELRLPWPWPRRMHAELIRRLKEAGARLVVFDVIFAEPTDLEDDQLFVQTIREAGNVILGQTMDFSEDPRFSRRILIRPFEPLRRAALSTGLTLIAPDPDGVVRHFYLNLLEQPCLPEVVVCHLSPEMKIPHKLSGLIDFVGPDGKIDTVSYYQALRKDLLPDSVIYDRVVLVGRVSMASPTALADAFYNPYFPTTGRLMSGVEIQSQIIHTLLQGRWGQELKLSTRLGIYLITILLFSLLIARHSPGGAVGILAGFIFFIFGSSFLIFWTQTIWLPPTLLSLGLVLICTMQIFSQFLLESRERRWLRHAFSHYVSPSLVEAILTNPEQLKLGGEERDVTVVFADLVGFSTLSEERSPEGVIRCLYDYFSAMTDIILSFQGTIDKYIGDALMAFWGAPLPQENHASLACLAALEMQSVLHQLQKTWQAQDWPLLSARVGIHSGTVIAGNVGSRTRFNYTVMGPTVNLAYRLEEVNRHYGTEIIISETTSQRLGNSLLVRELDQIQVKGRGQPVTIFELLGPYPTKGVQTWIESFNKGRTAYLNREWHQAITYFQKVLDMHENDQPAKLYLKRCLQYSHKPPPMSWNGVTVLEKS